MAFSQTVSWKQRAAAVASVSTLIAQLMSPAFASAEDNSARTRTPIKHVIVIIGENRTFDHVFATYKPKQGESVDNLLSKGIVNEDGTPGPNFCLARAVVGNRQLRRRRFQLSPGQDAVRDPAARAGRRRYHAAVPRRRNGQGHRERPARRLLRLPDHGGTGPEARRHRHAHPERDEPSPRPVPAHLRDAPLRRLRHQPGASLLPDVAAARLQRGERHQRESQRLQDRSVPVGRSHHRRRHQRACRSRPASTTPARGEGSTAMGFYNVLQGDAPYFK